MRIRENKGQTIYIIIFKYRAEYRAVIIYEIFNKIIIKSALFGIRRIISKLNENHWDLGLQLFAW